jgi:hypothetical protein
MKCVICKKVKVSGKVIDGRFICDECLLKLQGKEDKK